MSNVRVLVVDDEALARQRIRRLLQAESDVDVVGEASTGREAVQRISEMQPDIVCLDVQMPELDGFGVLRELGDGPVPLVLFVTAYDEHALRAFDVHAVDYVLKPVDADRFRTAFQRARTQIHQSSAADRLGQLLETVRRVSDGNGASAVAATNDRGNGNGNGSANSGSAVPASGSYSSRILVKHDGRMFFVKVGDIDWIEADRNYVRLHVGTEQHTIRERISHLEESLDPRLFARIHRSTIVNLNRVREMQQWFSGDYVVILDNGTRLRLSRHYRDRVEKQVSA
jgi:two-component system LytT family response regulator